MVAIKLGLGLYPGQMLMMIFFGGRGCVWMANIRRVDVWGEMFYDLVEQSSSKCKVGEQCRSVARTLWPIRHNKTDARRALSPKGSGLIQYLTSILNIPAECIGFSIKYERQELTEAR